MMLVLEIASMYPTELVRLLYISHRSIQPLTQPSHVRTQHHHTYQILNVEETASAEDIKKAYRRAALRNHPDKGGDEEKFKAACVAHSILSDEEKRAVYDETGYVGGGCTHQDEHYPLPVRGGIWIIWFARNLVLDVCSTVFETINPH